MAAPTLLPDAETVAIIDALRAEGSPACAGVAWLIERVARIEQTLEHYRPMLNAAEQRMNGPRLFGGLGAARVERKG